MMDKLVTGTKTSSGGSGRACKPVIRSRTPGHSTLSLSASM